MPDYTDDDRTLVNFAGMSEGEAAYTRAWQNLENRLQELENKLQTNLSSWTGEAQGAYIQAQTKWNASSGRMAGYLHQLGAHIRTAHENFHLAEKANTAMFDVPPRRH
jgi:early secretory antigenic target protein ESAT-6